MDCRSFQPPKIKRLIFLACTGFVHRAELARRDERSSQHFVSHHKHTKPLTQLVTSEFYVTFRRIANSSNPAPRKNPSARSHHRHSTSEVSTRVRTLLFTAGRVYPRACSVPRVMCVDGVPLARRRALIAVPRDCASPNCNGAVHVTAIDVMYHEDV